MNKVLKGTVKVLVDGVCLLLVLPLYIFYCILSVFAGKDGSFWSVSQLLSLLPGCSGAYLRKNFFRLAMVKCHRDCVIQFGTLFSQVDTEIGRGVYIGPYCNIGKSKIGENCTIGSNVHIMSGKEQHSFDEINTPVREQGGKFVKVSVGEDTWIGNGALIMATVGEKCIIGAGAVVTKDVSDYSIVAGNPARVIGRRGEGKG